MSSRPAAWAPPPKIWISGSGSGRRLGPPDAARAAARRAAAAACATAIETAIVALPPRRRLSARAVELDQARVDRRLVRAIQPDQRRRDHARSRWRRRASRRGRRTARRRRAGRPPRRRRSRRRPGRSRGRPHRRRAATSASTVGRPRLSQTRRPITRRIAVALIRPAPPPRPPAIGASVSDGASRKAPATRRTRSLSRRVGHVLHRRLAVDPGQEQRRQQRRRPAPRARGRGSQPTPVEIALRQRVEAIEEARRRGGRPQALQQQVVEAEGEVERRIAVPGALGVEEHWAVRPDQDVLRADVAMHQRQLGGGGAPRQPAQRRRQWRMGAAGRDQIGLQPDVVEDGIGRETLPRPPARPAVAAWIAAQPPADGCGSRGRRPRRSAARLPQADTGPAGGSASPRHRRPDPSNSSSGAAARHDAARDLASRRPRSRCARPARASRPRPAAWPAPA